MQREVTLIEPTSFHCTGKEIRPAGEFLAVEPDDLRDAVCAALSSRPQDQRSSVVNGLLIELKNTGVRVRESLPMLGVSASTTEELTATEHSALIRYARL